MKPVMQMQLGYNLKSKAGATLRDTLYLTVNAIDQLDLANAGFGSVDLRAPAAKAVAAAPKVVASAALGAPLYKQKGCIGCHASDGTTAGKTGPSFKSLYGSNVKLVGGAVRKADDDYLRRAIMDPAKEIVQGFEPGMPTFRGVLNDAEVASIILYIKSLGAKPVR